jgi:ABC-type multidrug transport system fused ATPase/permease subunit
MMFEGFWEYFWYDLAPIVAIPILIQYISNKDYAGLRTFSLYMITFFVITWIVHIFIIKWGIQYRYALQKYLINSYLRKSILKDSSSLEKVGTGKIQSIINSGMHSWAEVNYQILNSIVRTIFGTATGVYIIFKFDVAYVPYFIAIVILSCALYYYFRKNKLKYDEKVEHIHNDINKDYVRIIMSRQEVILSSNENKERDNLVDMTNQQSILETKSAKFDFLADVSVSGLGTILPFIGVIFLAKDIPLTPVNIAFLVSFIYFCSRFTSIMYYTVWVIRTVFDHYPKIKIFWNYFDTTPNFENYYKGEKFSHSNGSIELNDINFSYDDKKILDNFNLKIKGGQKIAFVGKSGSGKTTIAKLITGFVTPQEGQVLVDSQDLSRIALKTYYPYVGYLTQEPMVFDGSIKNNLLYSLPDKMASSVTDQQLYEALKNAECDFITDLNTEIGEKGIRLSGGERQRLAIAKLMLKNPEIIILDEPTSALDSFSEEAITRALDRLFKNKTVIIIAHRLQTVKKADTIIVLEHGKIIEQGTSEELVNKGGQYKRMLELQSF